jgi:hypothetical protein
MQPSPEPPVRRAQKTPDTTSTTALDKPFHISAGRGADIAGSGRVVHATYHSGSAAEMGSFTHAGTTRRDDLDMSEAARECAVCHRI